MRESQLQIYLNLFKVMYQSRMVDTLEEEFTSRGEAFFHVSGSGHEAVAALNPHLIKEDFLHCHYRDKALMLARGVEPEMFFHSLFCKDKSHSRGRQMSAHISDPALNILSLVGPVGNNALQATGVASAIAKQKENPIVLCAIGDGTSQQGEVLEAIAEAVRNNLPVMFLIEDNKFSISTTTKGKTFYDLPQSKSDSFYGIPIVRIDGKDVIKSYETFGEVTSKMRDNRLPSIIHFSVERLSNHTNADDQRVYRNPEEISQIQKTHDPIHLFEKDLIKNGVQSEKIRKIKDSISDEVRKACQRSRESIDPSPMFEAKRPLYPELINPKNEYRGNPDNSKEKFTMLEAIRGVLDYHLESNKKVILYGEDIEDPKGDVFGLTKGLTVKYPKQVINSALSEATILGVSIGRALVGEKPVAFLQFADFLPIAFNQIISELGSMFWRTDGGWECSIIVMITCGGYRPGLGPFHAQTLESIATHTPGIDVFMPSTAGDAAGLLNAAFKSDRPTLFFYPKSCLNDRENSTSTDISKQLVPIGLARTLLSGSDITFVSWGNGVLRCLQAAKSILDHGFEAEVIDLRSLSPWDQNKVITSAEKTGKLVLVHEDNRTCGMGAEIIATVTEFAKRPIVVKRITRADTYIPCNFENQLEILPSYKIILEEACKLLNIDIHWELPPALESGFDFIYAIGTSPSDESVKITDWRIKVNNKIKEGEYIGEFEADKTISDFISPLTGKITEILVQIGETVKIGTPLVKIQLENITSNIKKPVTQENPGTPIMVPKKKILPSQKNNIISRTHSSLVGLSLPSVERGSRIISNDKIIANISDYTAENILESTGIENRVYVGEGQNLLSMAVNASKKLLTREETSINNINLIIATTGTPDLITPSLACRILHSLSEGKKPTVNIPAYDINAACSGYLYALDLAYKSVQLNPSDQVLLITSEVLSPLLNKKDFLTTSIFADSATATLIRGEDCLQGSLATIKKPYLTADGESGSILCVPTRSSLEQNQKEYIYMNGKEVYQRAVRKMIRALKRTCQDNQIPVESLDLVVPHQANQNIIDSVRFAINFPKEKVFSHIKNIGNTSSSTIPDALAACIPSLKKKQKVGLVSFGGGFTYGATILEII